MREIIFRGKSADNGEWLFGVPIFDWYSGGKTANIINVGLIECCDENMAIPETVGQYTSLKDKNGKMIFEGDIVHIDNYDEGWNSIVEFKGGAFAVDVEGKEYDYTAIGWTEYQSIVIGNIHDNPELLDGVPILKDI